MSGTLEVARLQNDVFSWKEAWVQQVRVMLDAACNIFPLTDYPLGINQVDFL